MKKARTLAIALTLIAIGSASWSATSSSGMQKQPPSSASINLNSSRSNKGIRFVWDKRGLSSVQVEACLKDFDESGKAANELKMGR